jgi:hypothetical protein
MATSLTRCPNGMFDVVLSYQVIERVADLE